MKKPDKNTIKLELEAHDNNSLLIGGDHPEIISMPKNAQIVPFDEGWFMPGTIGQGLAKELLEDQAAANRRASELQADQTKAKIAEAERQLSAAFGRTITIPMEPINPGKFEALRSWYLEPVQKRADRIFPWAAAALLLALTILTAILVVPHVP